MSYCAVADVRALGITEEQASDEVVESAIAGAEDVVNRFTGDLFEPTELTVAGTVGDDGAVRLPLTVTDPGAVTAVAWAETPDSAMGTDSYTVSTSLTPGAADAVWLRRRGWDDEISGAEREVGGFRNLNRVGRRVLVTGTFGWAAVPLAVRNATVRLAVASLQPVGTSDEQALRAAGVRSLSVEGYAVSFESRSLSATTGDLTVDTALRDYRRDAYSLVGI